MGSYLHQRLKLTDSKVNVIDRFKILKKPSWCPPVPAFPIVWTILYCFMGYASYIVWTYGGFEAQKGPLMVYGLQLVLNLLWPIIFFKQRKLRLAMVENLGPSQLQPAP